MADFTEPQIQGMLKALRDDMGYPATRELAILELEDMKRKGCLCERTDGYCIGCSAMANGGECPMNDWDKRHPEFKNDELATKIKILEAGGEEAYNAKLKAQEEARKKAEEEAKNEASNIAFANDLKNDIIKVAKCEYTPHYIQDLLERYVQVRINIAFRYGKIQI